MGHTMESTAKLHINNEFDLHFAKDSQLERPVALKFLGNLVDSSEEFRQRFVREARDSFRAYGITSEVVPLDKDNFRTAAFDHARG